jgi:hypothetical protein
MMKKGVFTGTFIEATCGGLHLQYIAFAKTEYTPILKA